MVKLYEAVLSATIKERLSQLEAKPKPQPKVQARVIIESFRAEARQAMEKGYTLDEILNIAQDAGLEVSRSTLKSYLRSSKAKKAKPAAKQRKAAPQQPAATTSQEEGQVEESRENSDNTPRRHAGFDEDN